MDGVTFLPSSVQQEESYILCADCGIPIPSSTSTSNLCLSCLRSSTNIAQSIPSQSTLTFCRGCERYLSPPATWLPAELESRELLAICMRRLAKGGALKEVRLVDAGFVWTEPHSRRVKVKLTVQKEVMNSTVLQQTLVVEFVVHNTQCADCSRLAAKQTWKSLVQVRQKVEHKRTFLWLEQVILKTGADRDCLGLKEVKNGLDFHYATRQHAVKMSEFLMTTVPAQLKTSEQLVSMDIQNATSNTKTSFAVEIVPICKDDLVALPKGLARGLSNISPLLLCTRVSSTLHLLDPFTLHTTDQLTAPLYFRNPFPSLASIPHATEFVVLDIEPTQYPPIVSTPSSKSSRGWMLADAQVSPVSGNMSDDTIFHTRTHLGSVLKPGDTVLGYHLGISNFNNEHWDALDQDRLPEVVLVRKIYPARKKQGGKKKRGWKLRRMVKSAGGGAGGDGDSEAGDGPGMFATGASGGGKSRGRSGTMDQGRAEADYERFLQDLEEDEEMRAGVNLYKSGNKATSAHVGKGKRAEARKKAQKEMAAGGAGDGMDVEMDDGASEMGMSTVTATEGDEDDMPRIHDDELLVDEMEGLGLGDVEEDGEEEI